MRQGEEGKTPHLIWRTQKDLAEASPSQPRSTPPQRIGILGPWKDRIAAENPAWRGVAADWVNRPALLFVRGACILAQYFPFNISNDAQFLSPPGISVGQYLVWATQVVGLPVAVLGHIA